MRYFAVKLKVVNVKCQKKDHFIEAKLFSDSTFDKDGKKGEGMLTEKTRLYQSKMSPLHVNGNN